MQTDETDLSTFLNGGDPPPEEGQTSLVNPVPEPAPEPQRPTGTETADDIAAAMDRLLDKLPPEEEQAELAPELGVTAPPKRRFTVPLLVVNGWPERYTKNLPEPEGGEWKAHFAMAMPVIEAGGILLVTGRRGTGKTRLAAELSGMGKYAPDQTAGRKSKRQGDEPPEAPKRTAIYRTAMDYFLDLRATYNRTNANTRTEKEVIADLAACSILTLDEIQERGETGWEDRMLRHLVDKRYGANLPTILIANLSKDAFQDQLGDSIISRATECGRLILFEHASFRNAQRKF